VPFEVYTEAIDVIGFMHGHHAIVDVWLELRVIEDALSKWKAVSRPSSRWLASRHDLYLPAKSLCRGVQTATDFQVISL
jgi:hypothetical protein